MHRSPWFQRRVLTQKLRGFYQYFKLRHCLPTLLGVRALVERLWVRTLRRRSQKGYRSWAWFKLRPWFDLPRPGGRRQTRQAKKPTEKRAERSPQMQLFPA